ncbi:DCC1-like thiol-disulfide oxidoreductase family protein [Mycobacterium sp. NBC_00419]|uniref:thiol-disulfide oxidoreductase DCC family protein n=1 Tax=Mycobacterium sp. NBC_00419 TaxID=2975989 RepID=UPI002E1DFD39
MSTEPGTPRAPVLLYDGVCGVCNSAVRTVLRFDRRGTLQFAALDSDFARAVLARHPQAMGVDSAVFVRNVGQANETVEVRAAALLRLADYLGGYWKLTLAAYAIPPRIRDWLYDRFATFRYRIGGQYDTCPVPSPEVRSRFLDEL